MLDDLPAPHVHAYTPETVVAEKFEAAVSLGQRNSRMKDFHDLYALPGLFAFDGARLRDAIVACFERRAQPWTQERPEVMTAEFYDDREVQMRWMAYLKRGQVIDPPPQHFSEIGERIISFLDPVRESALTGDPFTDR